MLCQQPLYCRHAVLQSQDKLAALMSNVLLLLKQHKPGVYAMTAGMLPKTAGMAIHLITLVVLQGFAPSHVKWS